MKGLINKFLESRVTGYLVLATSPIGMFRSGMNVVDTESGTAIAESHSAEMRYPVLCALMGLWETRANNFRRLAPATTEVPAVYPA